MRMIEVIVMAAMVELIMKVCTFVSSYGPILLRVYVSSFEDPFLIFFYPVLLFHHLLVILFVKSNHPLDQKVATIFETPGVTPNKKVIFQTHTHELWITGQGFTRQTFTTNVVFDPPLVASGDDPDVSLVVYNRTHMKLTLLSGKKWAKSVQGGSSVELKVR